MLGKILIAAGVAVCLIGGVIMAAIATGTQMAHGSYSPSVQHYADQNAAAGNPVALAILGLGAALMLVGLVVTVARRAGR
jgi:ABC-type Na+ efflux pump permease subunit